MKCYDLLTIVLPSKRNRSLVGISVGAGCVIAAKLKNEFGLRYYVNVEALLVWRWACAIR